MADWNAAEERFDLMDWMDEERVYQDSKRPDMTADDASLMTTGARSQLVGSGVEGSTYWRDIGMYVRRASVLGLENPAGRQALAKGLMVYIAMVEAVMRVYGTLPEGGVPSGEILGDFDRYPSDKYPLIEVNPADVTVTNVED